MHYPTDRMVHITTVVTSVVGRKEIFLFNDALNTFYFMIIWCQTSVVGY